jgi:hypothetical protein
LPNKLGSPVSAILEATEKKMNSDNNELTTTKQQGQSKVGRPSKYEPETIERLLSAMSDGLTVKQACRLAGIGETTLSRWKVEHPELVPQLEQAREQTRQDALASIKRAGETDWRAQKTFLELSYPEYRQPNTKVEVNTSAQAGDVEIVCDEATRRKLIEARNQFLREDAKAVSPAGKLEVAEPVER